MAALEVVDEEPSLLGQMGVDDPSVDGQVHPDQQPSVAALGVVELEDLLGCWDSWILRQGEDRRSLGLPRSVLRRAGQQPVAGAPSRAPCEPCLASGCAT